MACATLRPSDEDPINRAGSRLICSELYPIAPFDDHSTDDVPKASRDASDRKAMVLEGLFERTPTRGGGCCVCVVRMRKGDEYEAGRPHEARVLSAG